ncbi:MAG: hypothetical protein ACI8Q6_002378 [Granulosicoccus sp.]|jgi:hypothetical protein
MNRLYWNTKTKLGMFVGTCLLALGVSSPQARAQDTENFAPPTLAYTPKNLTLLSVTSATVAPSGLGFISLSLTSKRVEAARTLDETDGSLAFGIGFGDAIDSVGVQLTAQITSLTDDFGDSGYFALNFSRQVAAGKAPIFIGAEVSSLASWGDAKDNPTSGKVMATWFPTLQFDSGTNIPLMITAGYGSHLKNGFADPAPYFGIGAGFTRNFGASVSWTGDTIDVGTAFLIDGWDNGNVTVEFNDVTNRQDRQRVSVTFNIFRSNLFRG